MRSDAASDSKHIDLTVDGDEDDAALARRLQRQYDREGWNAIHPPTSASGAASSARAATKSVTGTSKAKLPKGVGGSASGGTSEQSGAKKRKSVLDMLKESRART